MSYVKYSQGGRVNYNIEKYICDTLAEVSQIKCPIWGSTVYVIETRETYILNSKKYWVSMGNVNSPDIPSCDCVEELTIWGVLNEDGTVQENLD